MNTQIQTSSSFPTLPIQDRTVKEAHYKLMKIIQKQNLFKNSNRKQDKKAFNNLEAEKTYWVQFLAKRIPEEELVKPEFEAIQNLVNLISNTPGFDNFEKDFEAAIAYRGKKIFCLPVLEILEYRKRHGEYFVTVYCHVGFLDYPPQSTQTFSLKYLFSIGCRLISDENYKFLTANAVVEKEVEVIKKVTETKIVTQGGGKVNQNKFDKAFENAFHDIKRELNYNPTAMDERAFELLKEKLYKRIS